MSPRSWTSSLAGFSLALILFAYSLDWAAGSIASALPVIFAVVLLALIVVGCVALFRHRDYW